jgi:hypothetical protein
MAAERRKLLSLQDIGPWETHANRVNRFLNIEPIGPASLFRVLDLSHPAFPQEAIDSIYKSRWYSVDQGQIYIEVRNPMFVQKNAAVTEVIDFDDCLMSATRWHKEEYNALSQSEALRLRGVVITPDVAKQLYTESKITLPGKVERVSRYTPKLNLFLLSRYAELMEQGKPADEILPQVLQMKEQMVSRISRFGEHAWDVGVAMDADIVSVFTSNSPAKFVYTELLDDLLGKGANRHNLRAIATRGTVEGILGQAYKLHNSGVMQANPDLVIYSNDVKAEALLLVSRLIPQIRYSAVRVMDDNPDEIFPYRELAKTYGIENIEVVHVRHPDAKRRDLKIPFEPDVSVTSSYGTIFDHYFTNESAFALL